MMRMLMLCGSTLGCLLLGSPPATADEAAPAADPAKAEAAKEKAEVLEEKASAEGDQASPAPAQTISEEEVAAVDPQGQEPLDDAITCLARSIYWEAKGEDEAGMAAIANVVMNRLGTDEFPDTVCAVVKEGQEQGSCQFSWWCDGKSDDVQEEEPYAVAKDVARRALNGELEDHTNGALYFHSEAVSPEWATTYTKTVEVGMHLFYKPKESAGN